MVVELSANDLNDSNLDKAKAVLKSMIASCDMSAYDSDRIVTVSIERIIMQKFIKSYLWDELNEDLTDAAFDALKDEGLLQLNVFSEYALTRLGVEALIK